MVDDVCDDDATEGDIPDDHGSDHDSLASTVSDHSTIAAQDSMNDDDHHGVDIDNDNGFMDGLPHGETDPDGPMGGHGDSQALPTVLCAPEAAAPWVPVTSPIPGLTALPIGAQVMDFPLPTDVPTLATHPPHGETDPDGPMGGAGASEPVDGAETPQEILTNDLLPTQEKWSRMTRKQRKNWLHNNNK